MKSNELDDWSTHLIQLSINVAAMEDCLLHNRYNNIHEYESKARAALNKTSDWIAAHKARLEYAKQK